jgi:hypothetical protein
MLLAVCHETSPQFASTIAELRNGNALDSDTIERVVGIDAVIQTLGVPSAAKQDPLFPQKRPKNWTSFGRSSCALPAVPPRY